MAHYIKNRSKIVYDSYEEYVEKQDARSHDYDCPNCLKINLTNMDRALSYKCDINSVLDIGSRDSAYFDNMVEKGIKCTGIDISPKSVSYAKSKGRNVVLGDAENIEEIFKGEKFDLIISCHTLEHFLKPEEIMRSCFSLLNDKGLILIRLPDEGPEIKDTRELYAHTRTWSLVQVSNLLVNSGFVIIKEDKSFPNEIFVIAKKEIKMPDIKDFPLKYLPKNIPNWQDEYDRLIKDHFLSKKYNREKRLRDKIEYAENLTPEIKYPGYVLDLGPGPGEFLEICRYYGNKVKGIDSDFNDNLMGIEYLELSRLMSIRQMIDISYVGFENMLKNDLPFNNESISFINSQGSIEQIFSRHIKGNMRDKNYKNVYWTLDHFMINDFTHLFSEVKRIIKSGGIFLIFANGTGNTIDYSEILINLSRKFNFDILPIPHPYSSYENRIHKMRKN